MNTALLDPPVTVEASEARLVRGALDALLSAELGCAERDDLGVLLREARRVRGFVDAFAVRAAQRGRELEQRDRPHLPPAPDAPPAPVPETRGRDEANLVGLLMSSGMQSTRDARELGARSAACAQFPRLEAALARGEISAGHVDAVARQLGRLAEIEICELREREDEIVRMACREFVDPFARWFRNLVVQVVDRHRQGADDDELTAQRQMSQVTTFVDDDTGLRVTMVKLDPLRDHEFQSALRAHVNRLRNEPASRGMSVQELKVAAFMAAITAPFNDAIPAANDNGAEAGHPGGPGRRTTSINRPTGTTGVGTPDPSRGAGADNPTGSTASADSGLARSDLGPSDLTAASERPASRTPATPATTADRTSSDTSATAEATVAVGEPRPTARSNDSPAIEPHGGAPPGVPRPATPSDDPPNASHTTSTATTTNALGRARAPRRGRARVARPVRNVTVVSRVPKVLVVVDLRTLITGPHDGTIGELSDGTPVPLATIRELLPKSDLVPILISGKGQPLWVGRSRRLATTAQRDALTALYRTCARESCDTPVDLAQAHHAGRKWEHDGNTNIDELVPLCSRDHDAIHHGGSRIEVSDNHASVTWYRPDGTVESVTHGGNRTPPPG